MKEANLSLTSRRGQLIGPWDYLSTGEGPTVGILKRPWPASLAISSLGC